MTSAFEPQHELLRITDLHAFYGESHVLHGIDLQVGKGEVVTLLGRNGSGRTTTLKSIVGLVRTDSGLPFWNITVEFRHTQGIAHNLCKQVIEGPLACPQQSAKSKNASESADDDIPCFETDEFRIDQIKVAMGRDYVEAASKRNALLIALTNANLDVTLGSEHISFLHTGDVLWLPAGADRKIVDFLGTKSTFLLVSFKDSTGAAKP